MPLAVRLTEQPGSIDNSSPLSLKRLQLPRMTSWRPFGYYAALLATTAGVLLKFGLGSKVLPGTYVTAYAAVLISAWYGGFGPGCLATVVSAAVAWGAFLGSAPTGLADIGVFVFRTVVFLVAGASTSWFTSQIQQFRRDLEARVEQRTAALSATQRRLLAEAEERQHAEQRFRSAFEYAPVGLALVGLDGRTFRVNRALCDMLGYSEQELLSFPVWAVTQPDDMMMTIDQLQRLVEGEIQRWELEKRFVHKKGHIVWGLSTGSLMRDSAGTPLYVISQLQDITARKQAEVALQEERNFASAVVDTVGALVGVVDCDGRIVRFNRACERTLGYAAAEVIGRCFWDLLPVAEEVGPAKAVFSLLLAGKWPHDYETYWLKKDGTRCWLMWSTAFLRDEQGTVRYVVGSGIDITERKQAEAALRASEERVQHAFDSAPIGMTLVGLDDAPLRVNPALCKMLGYSEEELLRKPVPEVTHPEDMEAAYRDRSRLLAGEVTSYQAERRYFHKLGHVVWAQLDVSLVRAPDGTPLYLVTQLQDITARKQAEQALRESEERFQNAFQYAPIGIALVGLDRRFLQVNRALCDILGYAERELLALPYTDLVHPEERTHAIADAARVIASEVPSYHSERRYLHKSGGVIHAGVNLSRLHDHLGNPVYCVFQLQDITDRKRAEEMLRQAHDELEARVTQRTGELEVANKRIVDLLESMTAGFLAVDFESRVTYLNRGGEQMLQMSRDAVIGKDVWEVFPGARSSPFGEEYEKVRSERVPADVEAYYPPYNRWIRAHIYPTPDGVCSLFEDVTERHSEESAVLSGILQALNANLDVAEAFPAIAAGLRDLTNCDFSGLALFAEEGEEVRTVALSPTGTPLGSNARLRLSDLPAAPTVRAGRPYFVADMATEIHVPIMRTFYEHGYRSSLNLPLRGTHRVTGMLSLNWRRPGAGNAAQLPLLGQIADAVALATEKHQLFEQVRLGHERLRALSHRLLEVQEAERRHIARELHDEIGQYLTGLKLVLESVERDGPELRRRLGEAQQLVEDLVARVRELSLDLRPAMLDDLGLLPALLWLFDRYTVQTGVRVNFEHTGLEGRLPHDVETATYRIVQEALTNVARYAGVREVSVRARAEHDALRLSVTDWGTGFQPKRVLAARLTGGLAGIRERVLLLGGSLAVDSAPGAGTRLSAVLPLPPRSEMPAGAAACSP